MFTLTFYIELLKNCNLLPRLTLDNLPEVELHVEVWVLAVMTEFVGEREEKEQQPGPRHTLASLG